MENVPFITTHKCSPKKKTGKKLYTLELKYNNQDILESFENVRHNIEDLNKTNLHRVTVSSTYLQSYHKKGVDKILNKHRNSTEDRVANVKSINLTEQSYASKLKFSKNSNQHYQKNLETSEQNMKNFNVTASDGGANSPRLTDSNRSSYIDGNVNETVNQEWTIVTRKHSSNKHIKLKSPEDTGIYINKSNARTSRNVIKDLSDDSFDETYHLKRKPFTLHELLESSIVETGKKETQKLTKHKRIIDSRLTEPVQKQEVNVQDCECCTKANIIIGKQSYADKLKLLSEESKQKNQENLEILKQDMNDLRITDNIIDSFVVKELGFPIFIDSNINDKTTEEDWIAVKKKSKKIRNKHV